MSKPEVKIVRADEALVGDLIFIAAQGFSQDRDITIIGKVTDITDENDGIIEIEIKKLADINNVLDHKFHSIRSNRKVGIIR